MPQERLPIPKISKTALELERVKFQERVTVIMLETLEAMGLTEQPGWVIDFPSGFAVRNVAEENSSAKAVLDSLPSTVTDGKPHSDNGVPDLTLASAPPRSGKRHGPRKINPTTKKE